ncbi:MAG: FAD:protein FMN transferase [Rhodobacterales bacterium]|nr:FAD:protein FMN transferase [Rhodobacterales bacterium]
MSIEPTRHKLGGPVMGTFWAANLGVPDGIDVAALEASLGQAVAQVDDQMSTWKPDSDLMRLNAAPVGAWVTMPSELMQVLVRGLDIGLASDGAFDIGLGDLVTAWGFGAGDVDSGAISANLGHERRPTHEVLDLDVKNLRARKLAPLALDLSGIAKGYGVDRMMQVCNEFGVHSALVSIDGELRSKGRQPDGSPWSVFIEKPAYSGRLPLSVLELQDAAVATSGDYRHWVDVGQTRFSHTMDRRKGGPVQPGIASVSVIAADCMTADAMATAVMVLGLDQGQTFARKMGLECLILERSGHEIKHHGVGPCFEEQTMG